MADGIRRGGAPESGGSARRRRRSRIPGRRRRYLIAARLPAPGARVPRRLGHLPDGLHRHPELLRRPRQRRSSASTTTRRCSPPTSCSRRSATTSSGSLVVPALVTAIGLVFAVLTERIRWSVAFKTAVFMPMAISLFAAGVIWRIVYDQDPTPGHAQRGRLGGRPGRCQPARRAVRGVGRPRRPQGVAEHGLHAGKAHAGRATWPLLGLTASAPSDVPRRPCRPSSRRRCRAASPASSGETSSPAAARRARSSRASSGIPGVTVQLARRERQAASPPRRRRTDGTFVFNDRRRRHVQGRHRAARPSARPFGGVSWLGAELITPAIIIAYTWVWAGFAMVVIAAGLAAIPRDVLEAARTDGATEWQVFRRVTVPLLAPVLIGRLHHDDHQRAEGLRHRAVGGARRRSQDDANVIALAMWRTVVRRRQRLRPGLGDRRVPVPARHPGAAAQRAPLPEGGLMATAAGHDQRAAHQARPGRRTRAWRSASCARCQHAPVYVVLVIVGARCGWCRRSACSSRRCCRST